MVKKVEEECVDEYLPQPSLGNVNLDHLSLQQQSEVTTVCNNSLSLCLPNVFSEYPGFTTLVEHVIVLKPDAEVKRKSHRVPERLQNV